MFARSTLSSLLSLLLCTLATAQSTERIVASGLSLDAVLMRLQIRRWEYMRSVPDFFADEYVTSEMRGLRTPRTRAVTESVFRLRRASEPGVYPSDLVEARTLRRSNSGAFLAGSTVAGPAVLVNAFSNGLTTITLAQKLCYDFTLAPHRDRRHHAAFAINYRLKEGAESNGLCGGWANIRGQAVVEDKTFNIVHFDMYVPRYPVAPGIVGPWRWSIDYTPVAFDGATFFLPHHIESTSESLDGNFVWTFEATYGNYHKTGVHSRILSSVEPNPPSPVQP